MLKRIFFLLAIVACMAFPYTADAKPPDCYYDYGNGCEVVGWNNGDGTADFVTYCEGVGVVSVVTASAGDC